MNEIEKETQVLSAIADIFKQANLSAAKAVELCEIMSRRYRIEVLKEKYAFSLNEKSDTMKYKPRHTIKLGKLGKGTNLHLDAIYQEQEKPSLIDAVIIGRSRSTKTEVAIRELQKVGFKKPTLTDIYNYYDRKYHEQRHD